MKLPNLFRRQSHKARIAQLEAETAQLAEWNLDWQDYAAELIAQRDQYDALARDLADRLAAAQATPADVIGDDELSVLVEVSGKFPILNCPDPDFTGSWNAIDVKALPAGSIR